VISPSPCDGFSFVAAVTFIQVFKELSIPSLDTAERRSSSRSTAVESLSGRHCFV
jgi:hypothetical protein